MTVFKKIQEFFVSLFRPISTERAKIERIILAASKECDDLVERTRKHKSRTNG